MTIIEIIAIFVIHWIADFIMQDEKWALGKSKNIKDLLSHTLVYTICWIPFIYYVKWYYNIEGPNSLGLFILITFIAHTITDYYTSKIVSKRFNLETPFTLTLNSHYYDNGDILSKSYIFSEGKNKKVIVLDNNAGVDSGIYKLKVKLYNGFPNLGAFTIIGFDQVLHYLQLFLTYYWLVKM